MGKMDSYYTNILSYTTPRLNLLSEKSSKQIRNRATFIFPSWVKAAKEFLTNHRTSSNKRVNVYLGRLVIKESMFT